MNTATASPLSVVDTEKTDDARMIINSFFDQDYGLPHATKRLHKCLRSAFAAKSRLDKMDMLNMLYFIDLLNEVIEAAETLVDEPGCREKGAVITASAENDLLNPDLYCPPPLRQPFDSAQGDNAQGDSWRQAQGDNWDYFPRHLGRAEYLDPYWALEKCFRYKNSGEWKELLMALFYAASKDDNNVAEDAGEGDIYRSCRGLFKLVEACHLIKVRENR